MVCGCKGMDYLQNKRYTFLLNKMDNIIIIYLDKRKNNSNFAAEINILLCKNRKKDLAGNVQLFFHR
jgi:hypothetical protein